MKKIFLRNTRNYTLVDDDCFKTWGKHVWGEHKGYAAGKISGKYVLLHRLILELSRGECTDHINHNRLDNRKVNLRRCTRAQNVRNVPRRKNNTSGYTGVWYVRKNKNWAAGIGRPRKNLGSFCTKELAAKAYNDAAKKYFGEFACLNPLAKQ